MKHIKKLIPILFVAILICFASNTAKAQCNLTINNSSGCNYNFNLYDASVPPALIASGTVLANGSYIVQNVLPCNGTVTFDFWNSNNIVESVTFNTMAAFGPLGHNTGCPTNNQTYGYGGNAFIID